MEVLLFTLFFIVSLIFFISGKDDFGRKEKILIIKDKEKEDVKNEMELKNWDKASKESIAVAVCNGAVYEPELKTK